MPKFDRAQPSSTALNAPGPLGPARPGGVRFARSLVQTGVILGAGQRLFTMPPTVEPVSTTAFSRGAVAHVFCSHAGAVGVGYPREHEGACEPCLSAATCFSPRARPAALGACSTRQTALVTALSASAHDGAEISVRAEEQVRASHCDRTPV